MRAKHGCRLILALTLMVVAAACSTIGDGTPTTESAISDAGTEATEVVTTTQETVATDIHTIPAETTMLSSAEIYVVLEANQCLACHIVGDRGNGLSGPSLNGLAARVDTYGLEQSAESYIYESLVNPVAYLPASCPTGQCANVMPSYADRLSDDQLNAIVAFLLILPSESP